MEITQEHTDTKNAAFNLRPATMDDVDAVVNVINAASVAQVGRPIASTEEIAAEWQMAMFDLKSSTQVAELQDGQIIGCIEVWDIDPVPAVNWVWARVDPQYEDLGVGSALMDWADERLQSAVARVPEDVRVVYHSAAVSTNLSAKLLFEDRNMAFVRRFWHMMIEFDAEPPQPIWPAGITISTFAERDDLRAICLADEEAFRDHWGFVPQPQDEMLVEWQAWINSQVNFDPNLWFLAMDGEEIAGLCLCRRNRVEYPGAAWVNSLGVRPAYRKKGLGLALLHHAFGVFSREGKKGVGLGVDAANLTGATRLYERAGMSIAKQDDTYEKELRPGRDISNK